MKCQSLEFKIKSSLTFDPKKFYSTATNGKYILKPKVIMDIFKMKKDIVANEHLSMLISKKHFNIPTANCGLIQFSDKRICIYHEKI